MPAQERITGQNQKEALEELTVTEQLERTLLAETAGSTVIQAFTDFAALQIKDLERQEVRGVRRRVWPMRYGPRLEHVAYETAYAAITETIRKRRSGPDAEQYIKAYTFAGNVFRRYTEREAVETPNGDESRLRLSAARRFLGDVEYLNAQKCPPSSLA